MTKQLIYRVFQEPTGYFFCDDSLPHLDARGSRHDTRAEATMAAIEIGRQQERYEDVEFVGVTGSGVDVTTAEAMGCEVLS